MKGNKRNSCIYLDTSRDIYMSFKIAISKFVDGYSERMLRDTRRRFVCIRLSSI